MNELINVKNDEAVTTSLLVAEVFGKRHDRVIRAINNLLEGLPKNGVSDSTQKCVKWFRKSQYKDASGKSNTMYFMNRDGFSLLVMGFTGKKAIEWKIKYIEAFTQMESYINFRKADKFIQKNAMTFLADNLEMPSTRDYVKANTIADKAVSNMYGFPKMLKKDDMSEEMLQKRIPIMKDTVELMAIKDKYGVPEHVSKAIYDRYDKKETVM